MVRERVLRRVGCRLDGPFLIRRELDPWQDDRLRLDDPTAMPRLTSSGSTSPEPILKLSSDTLRELHDLARERIGAMSPLLRPLRELAHETGCAIMPIHHQNKQDSFRGSTAILAAFDQEW